MIPISFTFAAQRAVLAAGDKDPEKYQKACLDAAKACPEAWLGLGCSELAAGNCKQALLRFGEALEYAQNPKTRAILLNNIGMILSLRGEVEKAERYLVAGLDLDPRCPELLNNYSLCLSWRNDIERAKATVRKAMMVRPVFHEARFNLSMFELVSGDLRNGFASYEARFENSKTGCRKLSIGVPEWRGQDLNGKTILIQTEQGVGDTLQFARFLPMLADRGARVWVAGQRGTSSILEKVRGVHRVFEPGDEILHALVDYFIPMMSLAHRFGITLGTIPPCGYIPRPPARLERAKDRKAVGLVWAGSSTHLHDHLRSIGFDPMWSAVSGVNAEFHSMQCGPRCLEAIGAPIVDHAEKLKTYEHTAEIVAGLDLVVTVDTSVAHLCGAMGIPCWVLVAFAPDWRWLLGRRDSPWYKSVRLFRQTSPRDWAEPLTQLATELRDFCQ